VAVQPRGALGEDQREVQEERRQRQDRHFVRPEEHPVQPIEAAAEREREDAEEGDRQPQEVQRGRIARPAQPHRAADEQREGADAGEQEIQDARTAGDGRHADVDHVARPESQHGVAQRLAAVGAVQHFHDVGRIVDRAVVDGEQQIAALDADAAAGVLSAMSAATTPSARDAHSTPSSTSRKAAREAMLAAPRHKSTDTTTTGMAGLDQRPHGIGARSGIQRSEVDIQRNGAEKCGEKREAMCRASLAAPRLLYTPAEGGQPKHSL
jgi:hypothetical protein